MGIELNDLSNSNTGDVEFLFPNGRRLYATREILSRCPYYKTSNTKVPGRIAKKVFESGFSEAHWAMTSDSSGHDQNKLQLHMDDDYCAFFNVLYYIMTGRIQFSVGSSRDVADYPMWCDPQDVYHIADRLAMDDLKEKALIFLKWSTDNNTVTPRFMSAAAENHDEVYDVYGDYITENWQEVKKTQAYRQYFDDLYAREDDRDRLKRVIRRLCELLARDPA